MLLAVVACGLGLPFAARAADEGPILDPGAVVNPGGDAASDSSTGTDPTTTETVPDDQGTGTATPDTDADGTPTDGTETDTVPTEEPATPRSPAWGNAARRPEDAKKQEAAGDCGENRPPISKMLGIGGSVERDDRGSFGWIALTIAGGAALVAVGAYMVRRHRPDKDVPAAVGPLEITATLVAIVGGLAGLAGQFIPGLGVRDPPPAEARLAVREVLARITRREYADKTGAGVRGIPKIDQREVGQVFWLEVGLKGYRGKKPRLQYALYDPDRGGALLVGTGTTVTLNVEDSDTQTLVVPIWVGYPSSAHFQARFRLLDGLAIRQIAATGKLASSTHRYACDGDT